MTESSPQKSSINPRFPPEKTLPPVAEWSNPSRETFHPYRRSSSQTRQSRSKNRNRYNNNPNRNSNRFPQSQTSPDPNTSGFSIRGASRRTSENNVNGFIPPPKPRRRQRNKSSNNFQPTHHGRSQPILHPPKCPVDTTTTLFSEFNGAQEDGSNPNEREVPEYAGEDRDRLPVLEVDGAFFTGSADDPIPPYIRAKFARDDSWYYIKDTSNTTWRLPKCGIWACKQGVIAETWDRKSVKDKENPRIEAPMTWEERKEEDRKMWRELREKNKTEIAVTGGANGGDDTMDGVDNGVETLNYDEEGRMDYDDSRNYEDGDRNYYDSRNYDDSRNYETTGYLDDLDVGNVVEDNGR